MKRFTDPSFSTVKLGLEPGDITVCMKSLNLYYVVNVDYQSDIQCITYYDFQDFSLDYSDSATFDHDNVLLRDRYAL